jgi:hypothetical protein
MADSSNPKDPQPTIATWPVTSDHGERAITVARRAAFEAFKFYSGTRHSARLMLHYWNLNCDPPWSEEQLEQFLCHAQEAYSAEQAREWKNRGMRA